MSLGLGFSTTDGPLADISVRERNFLGRGQDLRIGTVVSFRSQQVDLSFTEPYFLDKNIAAGFDLFEIKTSPTTNFFTGVTPAYQQFSYGGALRAGYQITENLRQTWKYTARSDDITDVQSDASLFIQLQRGHAFDLGDRPGAALRPPRQPARADRAAITPRSATTSPASGFGVQYIRNKVNAGYYYSVAPEWVLSFTGEAGDIFGWGGRHGAAAGPLLCRRRQSARLSRRPASGRATSSPATRSAATNTMSARWRSACRSACRRNWASPAAYSPISARLWSNDQKNIVLTPAQLAATGGVPPIIREFGGDPRQRRRRRLLEIAGRPDPA